MTNPLAAITAAIAKARAAWRDAREWDIRTRLDDPARDED